jgi:hypothetical protein
MNPFNIFFKDIYIIFRIFKIISLIITLKLTIDV